MIFLLEDVTNSNELITYVASLGDTYKPALKTSGGKFLGIGKAKTNSGVDLDKLAEIILAQNSKDVSLDILDIILKDSSLKRYERQFFDVAIQIRYPKLCKQRSTRETINAATERYGYTLSTDIVFKHPFLHDYIQKMEDLPVSDANISTIFGFLFTNFRKSVTPDQVATVISYADDFNCASTRDTMYKLNALVWISKKQNQIDYGIVDSDSDELLLWTTPVQLDETTFPQPGGAPFGSLEAKDMQNWLDQFQNQKTDKVEFSYFLKQNNATKKDQFVTKYKAAMTSADSTNANIVFSYVEDSKTSWSSFVEHAPKVPLTADANILVTELSKYVQKLTKDVSAEASEEPEETPAETPAEEGSSVVTGVDALKAKLKKTSLKSSDIIQYGRRVAQKAGLLAIWDSKNLSTKILKLLDKLKKPLVVEEGIDDAQEIALNAVIIDWIKRTR